MKLEDVLPVVLHHHESWDGSGYPHRLDAEHIPLPARIVAVADAFDAMSSDRPYRKGLPDEEVERILRAGRGNNGIPPWSTPSSAAATTFGGCTRNTRRSWNNTSI